MIEPILSLQLYCSDADGGRLPNGDSFRLHNVDAPKTWKPKCEVERIADYGSGRRPRAINLQPHKSD
jgi:hypothetical protein